MFNIIVEDEFDALVLYNAQAETDSLHFKLFCYGDPENCDLEIFKFYGSPPLHLTHNAGVSGAEKAIRRFLCNCYAIGSDNADLNIKIQI